MKTITTTRPHSTVRWHRHSESRRPTGAHCAASLTAADLVVVREPPLSLRLPRRSDDVEAVGHCVAACSVGYETDDWNPPGFLWPHQRRAATRIAGALEACGGALLADQVGLGKTYVALAVATRYDRVVVVCPASLRSQWATTARRLNVSAAIVSHEQLSRRATVPEAALIVVDEAHRFRNPSTIRYDQLARGCGRADLLLVTATPIVNRTADLVALLDLFLPDNGLAVFGLSRFASDTVASELMPAVAPIMVSRSSCCLEASMFLPEADDQSRRVPTTPRALERNALDLIDKLAFPNFDVPEAAALLRRHLLTRLASSAAALRDSVARHLKYTDLCLNGQLTSRGGAAMQLMGPSNELQLDFLRALTGIPKREVDRRTLDRERGILQCLRELLSFCSRDPKAASLCSVLEKRPGRKTIVYVGATATAFHLATSLGWLRTAVVTGRGSRIASGTVRTDEALDLFAPLSRNSRKPDRCQVVDILIATDFASEGLDLQDADAIVHYDLPWNPIRLTQRLGRIRRLGSRHKQVEVFWFLPSPEVGRLLRIEELIEQKSSCHVVPISTSSAIAGKSVITGINTETRETLCARRVPPATSGSCVVTGTSDAAFGIRWYTTRAKSFTETVAFHDGRLTRDPSIAGQIILQLGALPPSDRSASPRALASLQAYIRQRLRVAGAGPLRDLRLSRRILRRGRVAASRRDRRSLQILDTLLDLLNGGTSVGAKRKIEAWLDDACFDVLGDLRPSYGTGPLCDVEIVAAVVGEAETPEPPNRLIK